MTDDDEDDLTPIGFVRAVVRQACWELAYSEADLPRKYRKLEQAKELAKRCGFTADPESIQVDDYDETTDLQTFGNVEQLIAGLIQEATDSISYHEKAIKQALTKVAMAKIMLARGNYTEIDFREIEKAERERAEEK